MSEVFYQLSSFRCPAVDCRNSTPHSWVCATDGTPTYLSQTGYIRCSSYSNQHRDLMCNWRWDCGNHGQFQWRSADFEGFTWALSGALQLMDKAGAAWVSTLCLEIGKQYNRT